MTKRLSRLALSLVLSLALAVTMLPQGVFAVAENEGESAVESEGIIVVFDKSTTNNKIETTIENSDAETEQIVKIGEEKLALATVEAGESAETVMEELDENNKVLYTQPNYKYSIQGEDPYLSTDKNVNRYRYQYHHKMMKVKEAWEIVGEDKPATTKVAVLDTGVDPGHEDLQATVKEYKDSFNGKIEPGTFDRSDHGTHVTGIIGATYNNDKGGAGVASGPNNDFSEILVVGASEDGESLTTYSVITGIKYAADNQAKVINMSFGGDVRDRVLNAVIKWGHYEKNMIFVAAAGNEDTDECSMPADIKEVISVCNCTDSGMKNSYTNFGFTKDVTAPGTDIASTIPSKEQAGSYRKMSGTSMSSPMVAGVCALMLDVNPSLTPNQVRNIICATAIDETGYYTEKELGYGLVDAEAAVQAAIAAKSDPAAPVESLKIKKPKGEAPITIRVEDTSNTIYQGKIDEYTDEGFGLDTLISPAHANAEISWTSSDESIATVDGKGIVRGVAPGEAIITATANGQSDTCKVIVEGSIDPTGVEFSLHEYEKVMFPGDVSEALATNVEILPDNATNSELYWTSSNEDVLVVDDEGNIRAKKVGQSTVTARTYNGITAEVTITVLNPPAKIEITKSESWLKVGEKNKFKAVIKDEAGNVMNAYKVIWESGNKYLASVDSTGQVTAKATGGVYIIAKVKWFGEEEKEISVKKKITIIKKNYSGKDYALKCTKAKAKNVALKWKKIPKASGYELYRATKKGGKYSRIKALAATKVTFVDKKTKAGKTYFYKVRAKYTRSGKTGTFGYSNIATVKIKAVKKTKKKAKK